MQKIFYNILIFILAIGGINAQIKIVSLDNNPEIDKYKTEKHIIVKQRASADTISLPFIEDFAIFGIYPDNSLWLDSEVFINNSYPDTPIFRGVATFDCLNKDGLMHSNANNFTFVADSLTSKPINLAFNKSDSIYFSFFYQPQGLAFDPPEYKDSLVLQFKSPLKPEWTSVWNMNGDFSYPFKQKMISITDTLYLVKGFQFRFINYASVSSDNRSSNGDYWNLDLIRIDTARTWSDTLISDIGFVNTPGTFLKDYYAMPWLHFENYMETKKNRASYRNYGLTAIGFDRKVIFRALTNGAIIDTIDIGTIDLNGQEFFAQNFYYTKTIFTKNFFPTEDSAEFSIKTIIFDNPIVGEHYSWNDTCYFIQRFYNYYAYDDGFPEAGIGIDGENSTGSEIAIKYYTLKADTLRAIRFWFNRTRNNANKDLAFDLVIRDWNNGMPGNIIYEETNLFTNYNYGLNNYKDYKLATPIILADTFCIGYRQNHEKYMNLGFDKNTDASKKTFYFIDNQWSQSFHQGSIMIRPVFGKKLPIAVDELNYIENEFSLYPNPVNNQLYIKTNQKKYTIEIYNQTGQLISTNKNINSIDISLYNNGLYLVKLITNKTFTTKKIIVNH